MKNSRIFTYVIGSTILSQLACGLSLEANNHSLKIHQELQEQAIHSAELVRLTADTTASIPEEDQTFENTLKPWIRLTAQIPSELHYLIENEIQQNPALSLALLKFAHNAPHNSRLNNYQRYLTHRFLNNAQQPVETNFIYLKGSSEEKTNTQSDFKILNFDADSFIDDQMSTFIEKIKLSDGDIIIMQNLTAADDVSTLSQLLKKDFAHFYIFEGPNTSCPYMIASKYKLENVQFTPFDTTQYNSHIGYYDFVITSGEKSLGHVYTVRSPKNEFNHFEYALMEQITLRMQEDFLANNQEMPFLLIDNHSHSDEETENLIKDCFTESKLGSKRILLLETPTSHAHKDFAVMNALIPTFAHHSGLLITVSEPKHSILGTLTKNTLESITTKKLILTKRTGGASADSNTDGSQSAEAHITYSDQTESGNNYSASVSGSVSKDPEGNTSTGVHADVEFEF